MLCLLRASRDALPSVQHLLCVTRPRSAPDIYIHTCVLHTPFEPLQIAHILLRPRSTSRMYPFTAALQFKTGHGTCAASASLSAAISALSLAASASLSRPTIAARSAAVASASSCAIAASSSDRSCAAGAEAPRGRPAARDATQRSHTTTMRHQSDRTNEQQQHGRIDDLSSSGTRSSPLDTRLRLRDPNADHPLDSK